MKRLSSPKDNTFYILACLGRLSIFSVVSTLTETSENHPIMNKNYILLILIAIVSIHFSSCEEACDATDSDEIGGEFFTVEYRNPAGTNYLESIYNQNGIIVFLDTTGGESPSPKYELITPGFKDGKFGPFNFTERYIQLLATWLSAPAVIPNEARGFKRSSVPCCAAPRRAKLVLEQEYGRYFASVSRQKPDAGKGNALARFGLGGGDRCALHDWPLWLGAVVRLFGVSD